MKIRESVHGSYSECRGFRSIERVWGAQYKIFGPTPLAALLTPKQADRWDSAHLFYKTSVDYVLCTEQGSRPLVAIDFDGMGQGYDDDVSGQYLHGKPTPTDPYRKLKFDLKLKFAREAGLPYHIVGDMEFAPLFEGSEFTVVDAIISEDLGQRCWNEESTGTRDYNSFGQNLNCMSEEHPHLECFDLYGIDTDLMHDLCLLSECGGRGAGCSGIKHIACPVSRRFINPPPHGDRNPWVSHTTSLTFVGLNISVDAVFSLPRHKHAAIIAQAVSRARALKQLVSRVSAYPVDDLPF